MSRARLIIKEFTIRRQGEIHFFQVRLPKNATHIIGIETDALMITPLDVSPPPLGDGRPEDPMPPAAAPANRTPFLKWNDKSNPVIGKLKLQSLDRHNIFFETWVPFVHFSAAMPDMSYGLFPKSPHTLILPTGPRTVGIPCNNTVVYGMYSDSIGEERKMEIRYKVKVFVWVQTTEADKGVRYGFETKRKLEVKL
ncbi:MAG: hypothetical protein K0S33_3734 [Bacteroidetes bacterium]|jgi:hypothetical protein|nr:hypothetical protein [Bacteroidota bacterium]